MASARRPTTAAKKPATNGKRDLPKPFLKWAGGKTQLVPELLARAPANFGAYHEPFMGGAALFFALQRAGRLNGKAITLSDVNQELVDTYTAIRNQVRKVIAQLQEHPYDRDHFYALRAQDPGSMLLAARAARMIYLNKCGFNGLYRVNKKGQFNVPFGRYTKPLICDEQNLTAASRALKPTTIRQSSFEGVLDRAEAGDFVYFDPPYYPLSDTAKFVSYAQDGFSEALQLHLVEVFTALDARGVRVMLSNSDTPWVQEHYKGFEQIQVQVRRSVNSRKDRRGPVGELLILGRTD